MKNSLEFYIYDISNNLSDNINLTLKNYSDLGSGVCIRHNNNYFFNKVILRIYSEYTNYQNQNHFKRSESKRLTGNIFTQIKLFNSVQIEEPVAVTSKTSKNSIFSEVNISSPLKSSLLKKDKKTCLSEKEIESKYY